jgi:hypothetical protein
MLGTKRVWFGTIAICAWLGCSADEPDDAVIMPPVGSGSAGTAGGAATAGTTGAGAGGTGTMTGEAGASAGAGGMGAGSGAAGTAGSPPSEDAGAPDGGDVEPDEPFEGEGDPWVDAAPRATCGSGDMAETGLQGDNGNIRCNLVVHGQVAAPHFLSHAWYEDCAYVNGQTGTTVIDVSDSANPMVTTTLTTTGMQSNWETMKVNAESGLLAGYQSNGPVLDVYDVSADCTDPVLQTSFNLGGSGHAGQFSPDGTIYYASSLYTGTVYAVDLTAPMEPKVITSDFDGVGAHDLFIGKQGDRGYFAMPNAASGFGTGSLAIVDTSAVQARAAGATGSVIHQWSWMDGSTSQYPIAISYRGRDYLMVTDELGSGSCADPERPPYGYARIFDISDEMEPILVSKIKTEAVGPCTGTPVGDGFFGVGTHYCNVDRLDDPRLLACGFWSGGLRVFDIRNPWRPKELAYFDTVDLNVPGLARIRVEEEEIWVATLPGTFYVLKFADGVLAEIKQE